MKFKKLTTFFTAVKDLYLKIKVSNKIKKQLIAIGNGRYEHLPHFLTRGGIPIITNDTYVWSRHLSNHNITPETSPWCAVALGWKVVVIPSTFDILPVHIQNFILCHEIGHLCQNQHLRYEKYPNWVQPLVMRLELFKALKSGIPMEIEIQADFWSMSNSGLTIEEVVEAKNYIIDCLRGLGENGPTIDLQTRQLEMMLGTWKLPKRSRWNISDTVWKVNRYTEVAGYYAPIKFGCFEGVK